MSGRAMFVAATVCAALSVAPRAQQARDAAVAPAAYGDSSVAGQVLTSDAQPRPVRRATVVLTGGSLRGARSAATDDQGRFTIDRLPSGTYTLTAGKPGSVPAYFGSRRPDRGPALPFTLGDGEHRIVTMTMVRGAVIAGTVFDQNGHPNPGVRVTAMQFRMVNGERVLLNVSSSGDRGPGVTDDLGGYRLWGLPPGTFILAVAPNVTPMTASTTLITDADLQWAAQLVQQGAASAPGMRTTTIPHAPDAGRAVAYSPVYYPGVVDPADATGITIGAGEERDGVDLTLQLVSTAKIEGTVFGPDGRPAPRAMVTLATAKNEQSMTSVSSRTADQDGHFSFPSVAPGHYSLSARETGGTSVPVVFTLSNASAGAGAPPPPPPPPSPPSPNGLWALDDLSVSGEDIANLLLTLRPGISVSGRIAFADPSTAPADPARIRVSLSPIGNPNGLAMGVSARPVAADGSFTLTGVVPGRYRLTASINGVGEGPGVPTSTWSLASAMSNGHDTLDSWLEVVAGQDLTDVTAVFDDRRTELSGTLLNAAGQPVPGYIFIVFPVDRSLWGSASRRTRQSAANATGRFLFSGLPPGDYFLGAVTDLDPTDLSDPAFLDEVAAAAMRVSLAPGEKKAQDIRLGK